MRVPVQRKVEIINSILNDDKRAAIAALEIGVSKKTIYSWLNRYKNSHPSKRQYALSSLYKKGITHPRASVIHAQKLILRLIVSHPEWGCRKISTYLKAHGYNIGYFAVYSFLKSKSSSTSDLRRNNQRLWAGPGRLSSDIKLSVVKQCIKGEKTITEVASEHHLARKTVYSWIHLYKNALSLDETGMQIFNDKYVKGKEHPRSLSSSVSADILDMVIGRPELSIHQLSEISGVSSWSVWRILKEHNLSTYQSRCLYANEKQKEFLPIYPTKTADSVSGSIWEAFTPNLAPAPPPVNFSSNNRFTLYRFLGLFTSSFILSVIVLYIINVYLQADGISDVIGASFSIVSLFFGTCLFFYSLKYYITLFIILSNSRTGMQASSIKMSLIERLFGIEVTIEDDSGLPDITNSKNNGLIYDLSAITLERLPFVSIHISTYNEKRVINRLLTAATSMDYPNYEVILADDSTDETIDIIKQWENHPRVKISRRLSRDGYKGGALREALKITESRAEFVLIFDADFIPYPDTITQFLKYFQYTAGTLDLSSSVIPNSIRDPQHESEKMLNQVQHDNKSNIAAVQGYQWHVLNKSENWITRGVRSEYSGSYVIERSGAEVYGGLKQISGSVYMIRRDVLQSIGWGTSITEDFELTLSLYSKGWKVVYTPYIQAPAEAVSTLKRLIRQRMRWAEGHSFNIKHMFTQLLFGTWVENAQGVAEVGIKIQDSGFKNNTNILKSYFLNRKSSDKDKVFIPSPLTFMEKLEFLYLTPYYLQAAFFILGTIAWLISETIFQVRLPFWTEVWGWSLVLTNLFALPLMNLVGLFMEESEDKDYQGLLSFVALSYIVAPFQAYAAIKGFIEESEGPWFRTPKTGRITDIFIPGRFARIYSGIFKGRTVGARATSVIANPIFSNNHYLSLATANNLFNNFRIRKKQRRWVGNFVLVVFLSASIIITSLTPNITSINDAFANEPDFKIVTDLTETGTKVKLKGQSEEELFKNSYPEDISTPRMVQASLDKQGAIKYIFHKEPRVRIKLDNEEIDIRVNAINNDKKIKSRNSIKFGNVYRYEDIYKGIDLEYSVEDDVLTERLILESYQEISNISYSMNLTGLLPVVRDNQVYFASEKEGLPLISFAKPYMYEKDNPHIKNSGIEYVLEKASIGYNLKKVLSEEGIRWLSDPERQFPVVIDPTVNSVVQAGINDTAESRWESPARKIAYMPNATGGAAWYVVHLDGTVTNVEKCLVSSGCNETSDWTVVTNDLDTADADTDHRDASLWKEGDVLYVSWFDVSTDTYQFNTIDTTDDSLGTTCSGADKGGAADVFMSIAVADDGDVYVSITERGTGDGTNDLEGVSRIAAGGCTETDILTGSGINQGDSVEIVTIGNNAFFLFDDEAGLKLSVYVDDGSPGWDTVDHDINGATADNDNTSLSAVSDGTDIWIFQRNGTTGDSELYKCTSCPTTSMTFNALTDPWTAGSLTSTNNIGLAYLSDSNEIMALMVDDPAGATNHRVVSKKSNADSISWGSEKAYDISSQSIDIDNLTVTSNVGNEDQAAIFFYDVTNSELEISTVPEYTLLLLVLIPFFPGLLKKLKKRRKKLVYNAIN